VKYHKLRIAWSVAWGIACLLLIALWVRSYWWIEQINVPVPGIRVIWLGSMPGSAKVAPYPTWITSHNPTRTTSYWTRHSTPAAEWLALGGGHRSRIWGYFEIHRYGAVIPYWFLLPIAASLATVPWMRHLTCRFSLRTLLIATTVVAVVLGWIVYAIR